MLLPGISESVSRIALRAVGSSQRRNQSLYLGCPSRLLGDLPEPRHNAGVTSVSFSTADAVTASRVPQSEKGTHRSHNPRFRRVRGHQLRMTRRDKPHVGSRPRNISDAFPFNEYLHVPAGLAAKVAKREGSASLRELLRGRVCLWNVSL